MPRNAKSDPKGSTPKGKDRELRPLTTEEIESLLDFILPQQGIPIESAEKICEKRKEGFRKQLIKVKVFPEIIPELKQELVKHYFKTLAQAGECVGVLCAQSIGEKQTQTCLNTFHRAGLCEKSMTTGAPRIQELLSASKDPKNVNCTIRFKEKHSSIQELRDTVKSSLVCLSIKDIATKSVICMDKEEESWYHVFKVLYNSEYEKYSHCVRYELNTDKFFEYSLSIEDVAKSIESEYEDIHCVWSPPQQGILEVFVDTTNITLPEDRILFIDSENAVAIYMEECVKPNLDNLIVAGIRGISQIFYTYEDGNWYLDADISHNSADKKIIPGNTFRSVLSHPDVDMTKTMSNNVWDVYNILGIEAARQFLLEEYMQFMDGINECHPKLLVEKMTYAGTISSITRYTTRKDEANPMRSASFEESVKTFSKAALRGTHEATIGVSASIICGKRAQIGTGMVDIKMDLDMLASIPED